MDPLPSDGWWIAFAWAVGAAVLLALAAIAHYRYWVRRLLRPLPYDLHERVLTPDGCAIELRRLLPAQSAPQTALPPVLLVHGIAINHRNLDLTERTSLARTLRDAGRDVWLLTLRSGRDDRTRSETARTTFDAMAHGDLPTAVQTVLTRCGAESLDYVGFSMGGMLLYACLGRTVPEASVRRVAIIGSPGKVSMPVAALARWTWLLRPWMAPTAPFRFWGRMYAFAVQWFVTPIHRLPFNPDNCAPETARITLVNGIQDVPAALNRDFARWALSDGVLRVDGQPALDGLSHVRIPVRFFAGTADRLASPRAVGKAFEAWGAAVPDVDKALIEVGRCMGAPHDYGHGDLAIGARAERDVFAPITAFLARGEG